jgi:hypothetical protein
MTRANRFHIPAWIVDALGVERTREIARATVRDLRAAGFTSVKGIPAVLDVLTVEAEQEQRRFAGLL